MLVLGWYAREYAWKFVTGPESAQQQVCELDTRVVELEILGVNTTHADLILGVNMLIW